MILDDERECHWRMVFEGGNGRVDGKKDLRHAKRWYVYNLEKEALIKGVCSVEVNDKDRRKVIL